MNLEASQPPWRRPPGTVIVVLPAYDEEGNIGRLLEAIDQILHDDGFAYEVLVVDDGSSDRTRAIAEEHARVMPIRIASHPTRMGLGATIRDGLRLAAARCGERDIVVVMDADNTHTPGLIRSMIRRIQEGAEVVIASRYRSGAAVRGVPPLRRLLSWGSSWLLRAVFPIRGVRDYTCGYRAYHGPVLRQAFERYGDEFVEQDGFQCMIDILLKLRRMDVIFGEVPLILRYDRKRGHSKMDVGRTIVQTLALVVRRRLSG